MRKAFSSEKIKYLFYTLFHPMDGFYRIRHQEKGSVPIAVLSVILMSFAFTANRLLVGFVVNDVDPRSVDSVYELMSVLILFALMCISNWSVTCLMNGEGRLKDIAVAIGYGTVPVTITLILATILSEFIADGEQAFYLVLLYVGITYGIIVMLIGIMQVHNYTLGKTILTLILTFAAFLVIVFLILLLFDLTGKVMTFFKSIYTEIIFRS